MGKNMLVSLAREGKFSNEGLQALDDDDDMLTAMARELVTQKGVGDKADEIWRQLQQQHSAVLRQRGVASRLRRELRAAGARADDAPTLPPPPAEG
jgi:hypothetical protein